MTDAPTKVQVGAALRWQGQNYTVVIALQKFSADGEGNPVRGGVAVRATRKQGYEREEIPTRGGGTKSGAYLKDPVTGKPIRIPGVEFLPDICVSDYSGVRTAGERLKWCPDVKTYKGLLAVSLGRVMTQVPQKLSDEVKDLARGLAVAVRDRLEADCPKDGFWYHPHMHFPKFQYPAPLGSSPLSDSEWVEAATNFLGGGEAIG